jgi:hypothetical protein
MTDTSLVGRVLAIFGWGLGIQLYGHLQLLVRPMQNIDQKIAQDNFQSHTNKFGLCLTFVLHNPRSDWLSLFVCLHNSLGINGFH